VISTTPDSRVYRKSPSITADVIVNNELISLEVGMKVQQMIDIYSPSMDLWIPTGTQSIPINIQNRSKESVTGDLLFWTKSDWKIISPTIPIEMEPEENAGVTAKVDIPRTSNSLCSTLYCQLSSNNLRSRIFEIPIFSSNTPDLAVCAIKDRKKVIIHNQILRCEINLEGATMSLYSTDGIKMGLGLGTYDYGPPFGFSEFNQVEFDYEITHSNNCIQVVLSQQSRLQPNLIYKRIVELRSGEAHISTWEAVDNQSLTNVTTTTIVSPYFSRGINMPLSSTYLCFDGNLIQGSGFIWPANEGDLPAGTDRYEPWIAIQSGETVYYHIYETPNTHADPSRNKLVLLEKTIEIPPLSSREGSKSWLGIALNEKWSKVREMAYLLSNKKLLDQKEQFIRPKSFLEAAIPDEQLFLKRNNHNLTISLHSYRNMPLTGQLTINPPPGWQVTPSEFKIENLNHTNPQELVCELNIPEDSSFGVYSIKGIFESPIFQKEFNFNFIFIDSEDPPQIKEIPPSEGNKNWIVKNKLLEFTSSPDFAASLINIKEGDNKYLLSNFPSFQPSLLTNQDPGGIHTILLGTGDNLDDPDYLKEEYTDSVIESDLWSGVQFQTKTHHRKSLKGLEVKYGYELLKGTSNIIKVRTTILNPTTATFNFIAICLMKYGFNDSIDEIICQFEHEENSPSQFSRENPVPILGLGSEKMKRISFIKGDNIFSMVKTSPKSVLFPLDFGKAFLGAGIFSYWKMQPKQKEEVTFYLVISGDKKTHNDVCDFFQNY
jgi:hypothetical protein